MDLSIVIVHYRTPELLRACLESLREHPPSCDFEVLVVDNASRERAPDYLARDFPEVRVSWNAMNRGFASGANQGMRLAHGKFLLLLNPDIVVLDDALDRLLAFARAEKSVGIAGAMLRNPDGTLQPSARTFYTWKSILLRRTFLGRLFSKSRSVREHLMLDWDHQSVRDVDWLSGACLLARREAVDDVGMMDERFFLYFEDVDWCARMAKRGWRVTYVPDAKMIHHYRRESAGRGLTPALREHLLSLARFWEKWSLVLYLVKRSRPEWKRAILFVTDLLAINLAFGLAYLLRQGLAFALAKPLFPIEVYGSFLVTTNLLALLSLGVAGLYRDALEGDWIDTLFRAGRALLVASLLLMASTFILYAKAYSRVVVVTFLPISVALVTLFRVGLERGFRLFRSGTIARRRVGIAGDGEWAKALRARLAKPLSGVEPIPVKVPPDGEPAARVAGLVSRLREERIPEIVLSSSDPGVAPEILAGLRLAGVTVHVSTGGSAFLAEGGKLDALAGLPVVTLARSRTIVPVQAGKRMFDVAWAMLSLVVVAIPALLDAFWVAVIDRATVSYRDDAVGRDGRAFPYALLALPRGGPARFVARVLSADRYLLFVRVLVGDMSFVGARPFPVRLRATHRIPFGEEGLRPGIVPTGPGEDPGRESLGYRVEWSLEKDLNFLFRDWIARFQGEIPWGTARVHEFPVSGEETVRV